jgi:transcriptional regulator with XRE-family HTH domain
MVKPVSRPLSQYSLDALALLGQLVREVRLERSMTTADLASRAGISRAMLRPIGRGDPGRSIGVVFEVATIGSLSLFDQRQRQLPFQGLPRAVGQEGPGQRDRTYSTRVQDVVPEQHRVVPLTR